jgi:biopolymer transport protein ExbD
MNPLPMDESFSPVPTPRKARVEIIPLIDVIFFLLATFVLFTLSLEKIKVLEAMLPKGGDGKDDSTVYLQASADGAYYWKQGRFAAAEPISRAELRPRLEDYAHRAAVPRVFIRGDRQARLGSAVALLDEVRRAGIREVAVETLVSETGR